MCYAPGMDLEYLFEAALVAIGPPYRMPGYRVHDDPAIPAWTATGQFNNSVREYNDFLRLNGVLIDEACSYQAFSEWFHDRR